jgi:2-keto-3-deoxy-L-fuconate dehydrogenase
MERRKPMFEYQGRRVVVTGGASGIGLAIARLFAQQKASVVIVDLNQQAADDAAAEIVAATGAPVESVSCNVALEASVVDAFARIGGPLDVLINCAGIAHVGTLASTEPADLDRLYNVNVRGTYLCMRAALAPMLEKGSGVILNMASIAATAGLNERFAYSMTKGAVLSMTLSVAKDYLSNGIRCNCISPARVFTPFVAGFLAKNYPGREEEKKKELAAAQPIGRMGTPEEIATLALYLCSEEASFLTGVDYPIDGGFFNLR